MALNKEYESRGWVTFSGKDECFRWLDGNYDRSKTVGGKPMTNFAWWLLFRRRHVKLDMATFANYLHERGHDRRKCIDIMQDMERDMSAYQEKEREKAIEQCIQTHGDTLGEKVEYLMSLVPVWKQTKENRGKVERTFGEKLAGLTMRDLMEHKDTFRTNLLAII